MDTQALALINEQLFKLKKTELKRVCKVLREKKRIKYSKLHKSDMIREITNFLDFSSALCKEDKKKRRRCNSERVRQRMDDLVQLTSEKRQKGEDVSREKEEYKLLRQKLIGVEQAV